MATDPLEYVAQVEGEVSIDQLLQAAGGVNSATGIYQDINGIIGGHGNFLETVGYFFDFAWFIFTTIILARMDFISQALFTVEEASHFTPVGLAVYAGIAIASIGIGYLELQNAGCGL